MIGCASLAQSGFPPQLPTLSGSLEVGGYIINKLPT